MRQGLTSTLLTREVGGAKRLCVGNQESREPVRKVEAWAEADFLDASCAAQYATFQPAPRSTIALSYNSSGSLLASTQ